MKKLLASLFLLAVLQGCNSTSSQQVATGNAFEDRAAQSGLHRQEIAAGPFILTTYSRLGDRDKPVTIYIEGEDQPFSYSAAIELTPTHPVALELASLDPSPNVVYIARPCQFTSYDPGCFPSLIKEGRFSQQVIASVNRAVDHFIVPLTHPQINLVGYGGGGAVAALIAAKRQQQSDVVSLRTIAGNLDPYGLARYEGYDGADDLIDPMQIASRLASIPQEHFVGDKDAIIPPFITANFLNATHARQCAVLTIAPDTTHDQGWEKVWRSRATDLPACGKIPQQDTPKV